MLKTFSAIVIAASLIAGPALAQAPTTQDSKISAQAPAPKAKVAVHHTRKPIAHKHFTKKHVAKKHFAKKHGAKKHYAKKQVKHLKTAI